MFRFSIRDVLWLTALVAMGICWFRDRNAMSQHSQRESALKVAMEQQHKSLKSLQDKHREVLEELDDLKSQPGREYEAEPGVYFLAPVRPRYTPMRHYGSGNTPFRR